MPFGANTVQDVHCSVSWSEFGEREGVFLTCSLPSIISVYTVWCEQCPVGSSSQKNVSDTPTVRYLSSTRRQTEKAPAAGEES